MASSLWRFKAMELTFPVPANRNGEATLCDPEGNLLILSEKGWGAQRVAAAVSIARSEA